MGEIRVKEIVQTYRDGLQSSHRRLRPKNEEEQKQLFLTLAISSYIYERLMREIDLIDKYLRK